MASFSIIESEIFKPQTIIVENLFVPSILSSFASSILVPLVKYLYVY